MLEPFDLAVLYGMAFATAVLSAVVGMAGGVVLLSVMLLYLEPLTVIPLHGAVQLVSNASRGWIQRQHIDWRIVGPYGLLLLPLGWVGIQLALALPADGVKAAIGLFVLVATWQPGWLLLGTHPEEVSRGRRFLSLGGVVGFLSVVVGATGPLIAPFFLNLGLSRQAVIGTKAACQTLGHVAKIALYGLVGFAFHEHLGLLAAMSLLVIAGSALGSRLLEHVNERGFVLLYRAVLTLVALRLLAGEVFAMSRSA